MTQEETFKAASEALKGRPYLLVVLDEEDKAAAMEGCTIEDVKEFIVALSGLIVEVTGGNKKDAINILMAMGLIIDES